MKKLLFTIIFLTIIPKTCFAESKSEQNIPTAKKILDKFAETQERPSVSELLAQFAQTQDKLKSYICKCTVSTEMDNLLSGRYSALSGKGRKETMYEFRYDGNRYSERFSKWGNVKSTTRFIPKDEAPYNSVLWDGTTYFSYSTAADNPGTLTVFKSRDEFSGRSWTTHQNAIHYGPGMQIFRGLLDDDRIDVTVRKAHGVTIRNKTDNINGAECYFIDAVAEGNKYFIWIDPSHGYNIVKLKYWEKKNNIFCSLENVSFEKINNLWIPMRGDITRIQKFPQGEFTKSIEHIKITEMILNPDHNALGSFYLDDIRNGAIVTIGWDRESQRMRGHKGKYKWQDGRVIDKVGRVIMDCSPTKQKQSQENKGGKK